MIEKLRVSNDDREDESRICEILAKINEIIDTLSKPKEKYCPICKWRVLPETIFCPNCKEDLRDKSKPSVKEIKDMCTKCNGKGWYKNDYLKVEHEYCENCKGVGYIVKPIKEKPSVEGIIDSPKMPKGKIIDVLEPSKSSVVPSVCRADIRKVFDEFIEIGDNKLKMMYIKDMADKYTDKIYNLLTEVK